MNHLLKGLILAGAVFGAVACGPAQTEGTEPQAPAEAPASDATVSEQALPCGYGGEWVCPTDGNSWVYWFGFGQCNTKSLIQQDCNAECGEPCVDNPA
jgi:hypothetical protein